MLAVIESGKHQLLSNKLGKCNKGVLIASVVLYILIQTDENFYHLVEMQGTIWKTGL